MQAAEMSMRMHFARIGQIAAWALAVATGCNFDQAIERRELIELLPTYAKHRAATDEWECEVRGWVYQFGTRSKAAKFVVREWAEGRSDEVRERAVERVRRFFVDKESDKPIPLQIGEHACPILRTDEDGIFEGRVAVPGAALTQWLRGAAPHRAPYRVIMPVGDRREFVGSIELIAPQGVSVISDIDDTLRVADVGDSKKVLDNTMLREYEAVPGMADRYARWARERGASFHYVSGSPLQLFPTIREFLEEHGFPKGSLHLRAFSVMNSRHVPPAAPFKAWLIGRILEDFPQRRFVFVGDSGEDDPEMYADLARAHPVQVERILIRVVDHGHEASDVRFSAAFQGVPRAKWTTFEDARDVRP